MRRWTQKHHRARSFAVSLLILVLLPTPWPKVEFHNVRHQDAPGQVCEYHDHLLRWHPDASGAEDVPVLHWHWAWPPREPADPGHAGDDLRLHASLPDEVIPDSGSGPMIVADSPSRSLAPPATLAPHLALAFALPTHDPALLRTANPPALTFGATFAPRSSLTSRLHRWSC